MRIIERREFLSEIGTASLALLLGSACSSAAPEAPTPRVIPPQNKTGISKLEVAGEKVIANMMEVGLDPLSIGHKLVRYDRLSPEEAQVFSIRPSREFMTLMPTKGIVSFVVRLDTVGTDYEDRKLPLVLVAGLPFDIIREYGPSRGEPRVHFVFDLVRFVQQKDEGGYRAVKLASSSAYLNTPGALRSVNITGGLRFIERIMNPLIPLMNP